MLDESLSTLETNQNMEIIEALRAFSANKPVIVVQHGGIEGAFDHVYRV